MDPLTRITYRDPDTNQPRTQSTLRRESLVDYENYLRPWERAHGSALHSPGVAAGLEVRATQGAAGVRVLPGLALNADGDHIVLAAKGSATFGGDRVAVTDDGAQLGTAGLSGAHVLTVAWAEFPDDRVFDNESRKVAEHTPRLSLRPAAAPIDERVEVVLAEVTFAAGMVTALGVGARRHCGSELALTRSRPSASGSDLTAGADVAARLRPVDAGLEIALSAAGTLVVAADGLAVRTRSGGTPLTVDPTSGQVGIGTTTPRSRLDVAGPIAVDGAQALSAGGGQLRLNPSGDFARGVLVPGLLAAASGNVGGVQSGSDPGAGILAVSDRVRVGKAVDGAAAAALVVDTDSADNTWNTAAFRKPAIGPHWSHVHFGPTGDWFIRSAAGGGKVVLQDTSTAGRVGVGTASPQARLDVNGDMIVSGPLTVKGALNLTGSALAVNKITSAGPLEVSTGLTVTGGTLTAALGMRITGDSSVTGSLFVDRLMSSAGAVSAVGGLATDGQIRTAQDLAVGGDASIGGFLHAFAMSSRSTLSAASTISGTDGLLGVQGVATADSTGANGVFGLGTGAGSTGVQGVADVGNVAYGVWGRSREGFAGFFSGKVHVDGVFSQALGGFRIDHPLDPENRYLSHSFVESPDMLNVYTGIAETDADGAATVALPEYFTALNQDFSYQLTALGRLTGVAVTAEIADNAFTISSAEPFTRVSWLVTGVRQDAIAKQRRITVEELKPSHRKDERP